MCRHLIEADPNFFEPRQQRSLLVEIVFDGHSSAPVIPKRNNRRRRKRVYRFGADERFDIIHIRVNRVLSRRRSPQRTLHLRAFLFQCGEPLGVEHLFVSLIGNLRVGDCDAAEQRLELNFLFFVGRLAYATLKLFIDRRIDTAHKEARDR